MHRVITLSLEYTPYGKKMKKKKIRTFGSKALINLKWLPKISRQKNDYLPYLMKSGEIHVTILKQFE